MFQKMKSLFQKKNSLQNDNKVDLCESEIKWNRLWQLYGDGHREEPIYYLCDYYSGVNGGGHFCFFDNKEEEMEIYDRKLKETLPIDLYENFHMAYRVFLQNDDLQTERACDIADEAFYRNEQKIVEILQRFADTL